jgi:hypothetical protein
VDPERLPHHLGRQHRALRAVDGRADDVAGEDIDHHGADEIGALDRPSEFRDVPRIHLPRPGRDELWDLPGRVPGETATFPNLPVLGQDPLDR